MGFCSICRKVVVFFPGAGKNAGTCHCGACYHFCHTKIPTNCINCNIILDMAKFYIQKENYIHFVIMEKVLAMHDERNATVRRLDQSQRIAQNIVRRCNDELENF